MKKILVIGANSAIAAACAQRWATPGAEFFLVSRHAERLRHNAADLTARGASRASTRVADLDDWAEHAALIDHAFAELQQVDICLIAHGSLPDQTACEQDVARTLHEFTTNGLSVLSLLTLLANRLESQGHGTLAVISSVAGDRGRPSNYVYGSAKAAVSSFCEGLRGRLYRSGVHVLTIKPGFVDTPMTHGLPLPRMLVATTDRVADDIVEAVEKQTNVLYTPWFWRYIMLIIVHIPRAIFKRLRL